MHGQEYLFEVEINVKDKMMTHNITLYTKSYCPHCKRARALLWSKFVTFEDIEITDNPSLTADMIERSGRITVPQIFIGDSHVGGSKDLLELEAAGGLDPLLEALEKPKG